MKQIKLKVQITFTESLLGSASNNPEIQAEFIASKAETPAQSAEEVAAIPVADQISKSMTVFPRDEKGLFMWDYQVRGFLKNGLGILIELGDSKISKWQYKRAVDSLVFIHPRRIYLLDPEGKPYQKAPETLQRPLRADTMQGERIALANSEMLPAGTQASFEITVLEGTNSKSGIAKIDRDILVAILDYGAMHGFGQWRGGGYGRFTWKEIV